MTADAPTLRAQAERFLAEPRMDPKDVMASMNGVVINNGILRDKMSELPNLKFAYMDKADGGAAPARTTVSGPVVKGAPTRSS